MPPVDILPTLPHSGEVETDTGDLFATLAPTVTLHDVELCRVGTWRAGTGVAPITLSDLEAILAAAQDSEVDRAPLVIGHLDPRFRSLADGEPAIGWCIPRRVTDGRLIGDLVDVPAKLASVIPKAYGRRSVELRFGVTTPTGHTHSAVLSALALLGVKNPAVKGLADITARYSESAEPSTPVTVLHVGESDTPDPVDTSDTSGVPAGIHKTQAKHSGGAVPAMNRSFTDDRLRQLLGLDPDVDVTGIHEAMAHAGQPAPAEVPAEVREPIAASEPVAPPAAPATPATLDLPEGTVLLSEGQLADLQARAQRGEEAAVELDRQRRDRIVDVALSEGRLSPDESTRWREALDRDETGTVPLLQALAKGRVPTSATTLGSDAALSADEAGREQADKAWDDWERKTFPEVDALRSNLTSA